MTMPRGGLMISQSRTRAFARVMGPWLVIVPGIVAFRAPDIGALASDFFKSNLFVWFSGAGLLFVGQLIIAFRVIARAPRRLPPPLARTIR